MIDPTDERPGELFGGKGWRDADWHKVWAAEGEVYNEHFYTVFGDYYPAGDAPEPCVNGYINECQVWCGDHSIDTTELAATAKQLEIMASNLTAVQKEKATRDDERGRLPSPIRKVEGIGVALLPAMLVRATEVLEIDINGDMLWMQPGNHASLPVLVAKEMIKAGCAVEVLADNPPADASAERQPSLALAVFMLSFVPALMLTGAVLLGLWVGGVI